MIEGEKSGSTLKIRSIDKHPPEDLVAAETPSSVHPLFMYSDVKIKINNYSYSNFFKKTKIVNVYGRASVFHIF